MIFDKFTQQCEIRFWDIVIMIAQEEGPVMKLIKKSRESNGSRLGTFLLLILIWAAVGFTVGMIFGRLMALFQYF
ncbi:MAG: hypothetical protein RQ728_04420 [Brevefilum sp.]|nr:hypothetical protein [Brevefilum sp.]MDT8381481.1 hypothetical protein [Brevefilum sp.]MDW7755049.1 hypothetical protein [Brevefilum sp.]